MPTPIIIPGFTGKPPVAASKADYTNVFFHGDNLEDGIASSFDFETDNFARQGFYVRKPRVVRLLFSPGAGTPATAFTNHYNALSQSLANSMAEHGICVAWGKNSGGLTSRWLQDATPDFAEDFDVDEIVGGSILTFVFVGNNLAYGTDLDPIAGDYVPPLSAAAERYEEDYDRFVARYSRMEAFQGNIYTIDPAANDQAEITHRAVAGTSPLAQFGPGLATFGWSVTTAAWDTTAMVSLATIQAEVEAFFDL